MDVYNLVFVTWMGEDLLWLGGRDLLGSANCICKMKQGFCVARLDCVTIVQIHRHRSILVISVI